MFVCRVYPVSLCFLSLCPFDLSVHLVCLSSLSDFLLCQVRRSVWSFCLFVFLSGLSVLSFCLSVCLVYLIHLSVGSGLSCCLVSLSLWYVCQFGLSVSFSVSLTLSLSFCITVCLSVCPSVSLVCLSCMSV